MRLYSMLLGFLAVCMTTQLCAQEKQPAPRATLAGAFDFKVSPGGKTVATGHGRLTGVVDLWDVSTGKKIGSCGKRSDGHVHLLAYSPDGKILASCGSGSGIIILSDVTMFKDISTLNGPYEDGLYRSIAFSSDGKMLAAGVDGPAKKGLKKGSAVVLWDIGTGRMIATYKDFSAPVTSLAFTSDGKTIITGESGSGFGGGVGFGADGKVKIWDIPSSQVPDK
jgi:WD40 repeat protein